MLLQVSSKRMHVLPFLLIPALAAASLPAAAGILKAGFDNPLPSAADGCVTTSFSPGLPEGKYTIKMQKQWTPVFATTSFYLANARV